MRKVGSRMKSSRLGKSIRSYPSDPFSEGILPAIRSSIDSPDALMDIPAAKMWFETISQGCDDSLYTYQLPLSRAVGVDTVTLGSPVTMFSSYSYLSLNRHPRINAAASRAIEEYGTTAGGARMLTGTLELHLMLEAELAAFLGTESATTYASGYDANIGAITALFDGGDVAVLDQFTHRSLKDAVAMAGCRVLQFAHNRLERLESHLNRLRRTHSGRILIAVEGVYSMEGDEAPLADLIALKDAYGALLLVDDAHGIGVMGSCGQGTAAGQGIDMRRIDILTGSLGKAVASTGGFVAGSFALKAFLHHHSAPFFFSGAMSPANCAAALESLRVIRDEPQHLACLRENSDLLRKLLVDFGLEAGASTSAVIPLVLGSEQRAWRWARELLNHGIVASAIPYPAVPVGQSRLRLCATSGYRQHHFDQLARGLTACLAAEREGQI